MSDKEDSESKKKISALDFEKCEQRRLADIPVVISIGNQTYALAAVVLFSPLGNVAGLGHFTAAVRINNQFEVYDDLREKPYGISKTTEVCVHSLLYVLTQKWKKNIRIYFDVVCNSLCNERKKINDEK